MKRLLNTLTKRGFNAELVNGEDYEYIAVYGVLEDDYIEITNEDDEPMIATEDSSINIDSLKIADVLEAIKSIQ